ncbi:type VII secretion-associated serine protease mycosin [Allokutzneria oryzae]|uniref:Type VII secretion-associated serine protease mycosin n=1 Tax=Allokutzneria oryzae TaxID=1378989 RepID=A0ABV6A7I6_9PSEU
MVGLAVVAAIALAVVPPVEQPGGLGERCIPPATVVEARRPWAQHRLMPERVWPLTKGAGVTVAVVDTGVDGDVPQLAGRVLPGRDVTSGRGGADDDCVGHGTFVAGIIAAAQVNGIGFAGVAPEATILPIRQSGDGKDGSASGLAAGIRAAVDAGARVINVSAAAFYTVPELAAAVDYATAKDVLIVAAAANAAQEGNPKAYPAAYPAVVAVAATGVDGARGQFSETGDYISLAAPGVDVLSVGPRGPGHLAGTGTSYAAPFVAGTAALVRAYHPTLTAAQVKDRLIATADHPPRTMPDPQVGWGVVNPYAAVTAVLPETKPRNGPVTIAAPAPPKPVEPAVWIALAAAAGVAVALAGLAGVRQLAPQGRRRGWRPGTTEETRR